MKLLEQLCQIHAPSGSEYKLSEFLLKYIEENKSNWKNQPIIHHGEDFLANFTTFAQRCEKSEQKSQEKKREFR